MTPKEAKKLIAPAFKHQPVTLTDEQIEQLISTNDYGICFDAYLVCRYSEEAGRKLRIAAYELLHQARAA